MDEWASERAQDGQSYAAKSVSAAEKRAASELKMAKRLQAVV